MHGKTARPAGVEPATYGFVVRRSIQLSYGRVYYTMVCVKSAAAFTRGEHNDHHFYSDVKFFCEPHYHGKFVRAPIPDFEKTPRAQGEIGQVRQVDQDREYQLDHAPGNRYEGRRKGYRDRYCGEQERHDKSLFPVVHGEGVILLEDERVQPSDKGEIRQPEQVHIKVDFVLFDGYIELLFHQIIT